VGPLLAQWALLSLCGPCVENLPSIYFQRDLLSESREDAIYFQRDLLSVRSTFRIESGRDLLSARSTFSAIYSQRDLLSETGRKRSTSRTIYFQRNYFQKIRGMGEN